MLYLLLKALHIIAMVCWFAGLFYLPRLFVYHAQTHDLSSYEKFCIMERRLYRYIMNPAMMVTIILGLWMLYLLPGWLKQGWLHLKLTLVFILLIYHVICGVFVKRFAKNKNTKDHVFLRFFNEFPTIILITVVIMAVIKPF